MRRLVPVVLTFALAACTTIEFGVRELDHGLSISEPSPHLIANLGSSSVEAAAFH
jgi:hypothetical protein